MKRKATVIITASVGVGLFVSRVLAELVPDALAIGLCMFVAGAVGGFVCGIGVSKDDRPGGAHHVSRGFAWIGKHLKDDDE